MKNFSLNPIRLLSESDNSLTLLLWLRSLSFGVLFSAALISAGLPENFFAQLINWPLLSSAVLLALLLTVINFLLRARMPLDLHVFSTLLLDSLLWFMAIAATGGAINPAVSYVLILLCVAVLVLNVRHTLVLFVVMAMAYAAQLELSPHHHHAMMMSWHLWGMWLLFILNASIMLWVMQRLIRVIREREQSIASFREQQVKDEKLIAMGTLSASIAHELSTPLSTIAVLVEDEEGDEADLIRQQLERCKSVLNTLRNEPEHLRLSVDDFLQGLSDEILLLQPEANLVWHNLLSDSSGDSSQAKVCFVEKSPLLNHALLALLNNAIEASKTFVNVSLGLSDDAQQFCLSILHDGEAISEDLLKSLGKQRVASNKGMGIGNYLANASIEQLGGQLFIQNSDEGVLTQVYWQI